MLSSNNWKEQIRKQEPKKQRFTIKKLTVGVASVLIGFTFMGASALADDNVTTDNSQNEPTNTAIANNNQTANSQATAVASTSEANSTANDSDAANTNTLNVQQAQTANADASALQESKDEVNNTENQAEVNDYAGLISALKDKNINTITLTGDIDGSTARSGYDTIDTAKIAHTVTIDGQGQYSFNMGNRYIYLTNNTESNNDHWNITFSNIKNIQAQNQYGLICIYSKDATKDFINFNNVTVDPSTKVLTGKYGSQGPVNVTFSGTNKIKGTLTGTNALVNAHNLEISGTTTVTPTANSATQATSFSVAGNAIIDSGAQLNITSTAKNVAGITFTKGADDQTIDNSTAGVLRLMPNAQVTMNLGAGKSMAVMRASDIDLQDSSQLTVNTKMDTLGNQNPDHKPGDLLRAYAPIELDSTQNDAKDSTVRISNNAKLTIIRSGVQKSDSALLSFGPNDGLGNSYHLLVNGGSIDLEDSAYSTLIPDKYLSNDGKVNKPAEGWAGIISMWGTSSSDEISFNNAKMIKLVRTANNKLGYLIHTDSAGDVRSHSISVTINNTGSNAFTPLTMIPAGSTTPVTWNIKYLSTKSQGGTDGNSFRNRKTVWNQQGSKDLKGSVNDNIGGKNEVILAGSTDQGSNHFDNGQVVPENGKTTASPELNNFINHFSWWNCKGVSFGTDLQEVAGTVTYVDDAGKTVANKNGQNSLTFNFQKSAGLSADTLDKAINDNIPTNWKLKPEYTLPGAQTDTFNIKVPIVHATQTVTPGDPGVTPDKTSYKDLFTTSTRTINVYKTDGTLDHEEKQTVTFGRTGILDKVTGDITVNPTSPWHVYNTTTNKLTDQSQGSWSAYPVPTKAGYTSHVSGGNLADDATNIPASAVTAETADQTINITYTKQGNTPVPYDPTKDNMKMSVSRTIKYDVDGTGHAAIPDGVQTVNYSREDEHGNAGYQDPVTGDITWNAWHVVNNGKAEFPEYTIVQIPGYDSEVNGTHTTTIFASPIAEENGVPQNAATITVTYKANHGNNNHVTVYYGQTTAIYTIGTYDTHKTSDGSATVAVPKVTEIEFQNNDEHWNVVNSVTYKLSADGTKYVASTSITDADGHAIELLNGHAAPESFDASDITTAWLRKPNTNVSNFSGKTSTSLANDQYTNPNGDQRTGEGDDLPGNSKVRANITLKGTAATMLPEVGWINVFGNIYGATQGTTQTFKQNSDISGLSQDQYRQLVNVTDLGKAGWNGTNINPNAPQVLAYVSGTDNAKTFAMTWAPNGMPSTATVASNVQGTVRILFSDGTYLDVPVSVNIEKDNNGDKPDQDKTSFNQKISYQYNGQEVASYTIADIAKGSSLTAAQLRDYINNNLPANYSIADGYTFPAAESNITATPATLVVPLKQSQGQHDHSNYNATVDIKYVGDQGQALQTKDGKDQIEFNFNTKEGLKANILKNAIDSNIPAGWKIASGFTYPGDQTQSGTITVNLVKNTVTPGEPGVTPDNPSYKDLFTTSTRTINVYKTDGTLDHTETQTVTFGRTGVLNQYTGEIISGSEGPWYVYSTTTNKLTNNKQGTWIKYDVPTHDGYNLLIDGVQSDTASVPAVNTVDPDTNVTVNVKYTATEQNYTQSIKYVDEQGHTLATTANAFTGTFTVTNPATISADQIKTQIKHDLANNHSLKGWVVAGNYPAAEMISEQAPDALVVTLKHGTKPVTPVDPGVNPNDTKYKDMFTTVTRKIYQTKPGETEKLIDTQYVHFGRNGIEDLVTGKVTADPNSAWEAGTIQDKKFIAGGSSDFASEPVEQITNYDSYVDGVKTTTISSASALQNGQPTNGADVQITYVSNNQTTPIPYDPSNDQMNKYVTRTITVHKTDGKTATIEQIVHFVRGGVGQNAGTKDKDGNITWANWMVADNDNKSTGKAEGQWKEYDVPAVDGYTSTVDGKDATKVNAQDVDVDTPDANVTVAYTKTYNPTDPTINPNKPTDKYKNMYAHPTRTINVVNPVTGKTDTTSQVVWYGRTMTISSEPNVAVKYGDWTLGKVENDKFVVDNSAKAVWDEFTAPTFDGYTPSQSTVAANNNVTATTPNETVTITYVANHETTPIPYDPSNDQMNKYVTRTITVHKTDGKTATIEQIVHFVRGGVGQNAGTKDKDGNITWTNWTVADNDNKSTGKAEGQWKEYDVPAVDGYTSTVDGKDATKVNAQDVDVDTPDANVTVAYTKTYNPTDPTINPNNPTDQYKNMYVHPTRTIKVHNPQTGLISTANQTVWFGRTMTISSDPNVAVKYGEWTLGKVENNKFVADPTAQAEWGEFDAPTFTNYTPNIAKLNAQKVTATTKDEQVDITYTATKPVSDTYSQNIVYQTANGTVVETARGAISGSLINGSATVSANDANTAINDHMPAGYEYVTGKLTDAEIITSAQPNALIVTVKANGPVTPTTTDAQQYEPSYKDTTVNATNPVNTGAPIFTKDGHQVSAPAGTKFSFSNGNTTMTINDKKNGNPVTATIDANTGVITFTAPDAATEYDVAVTVTYPDASTDPAVAKVFVNKTYDPTKVDPNDPNYENMFTTVTRDIITTDPTTGKDTTNTQKVTFGRTMTIHGDGSAPEYGAWEVGTLESPEAAQTVFMVLAAGTNHTSFVPGGRAVFGSEPINQIPGYTSEVNGLPATEVPEESALRNGEPTNGPTIHVTYHKDGEKPTPTEGDVVITYVDKKNPSHVLGTTSVSGNTGSSVDVKSAIENNVPAKWTLDPDYTIPTTAEVPGAIQVPLVHATKTVKPSDPGVNPSDDQDMFKTVTRIINVENPVTGNTDTHTQQVNFSRSKTIDEVTNEVLSYGAWTPAEGQWAEFDAPEFSGYTPSQAVVAAETVTADTADATVTITYKSNNGGNHNPGTNPQPGDHHNPGNNDHHNNGGNTNPGNNNGGQPTNTNHGNDNNAGDNTNDHSNAQNNKQALPQTGNTKDTAAVAGLGLAGLTALLGLGGRKKKEN